MIIAEKGVDFLVSLLETLSNALGYNFDKVELKRGGYYPQGQFDDVNARAIIRDSLVKVLSGDRPIPMSVVSFHVPEEATKNQIALQKALLKTLSGEQPLKIKSES